MGIHPGDAVLVIEHRGEQQIVYNALVAGISMRGDLLGSLGEPAIKATFVAQQDHWSDEGIKIEHETLSLARVVHISHRDWIEGRAGLAYEELPGSVPGVCRYCRCTERRACPGGCGWLYPERTVCSSPDCAEKFVRDNLLRQGTANREALRGVLDASREGKIGDIA